MVKSIVGIRILFYNKENTKIHQCSCLHVDFAFGRTIAMARVHTIFRNIEVT